MATRLPSTFDVNPAVARVNAPLHAPHDIIDALAEIAVCSPLTVLLDLDSMLGDASTDRALHLALDALSHADVQVVFASTVRSETATRMQYAIARSLWIDRSVGWRECGTAPAPWTASLAASEVLSQVRDRLPDTHVILFSDDELLLRALSARDRGLAIRGDRRGATHATVARGAISLRATLWWIVALRAKTERTHV